METKLVECGSREWFKQRARQSLKKIGNGQWDFSDSALLWTNRTATEYKKIQVSKGRYKKQVTDSENIFLKDIAPQVVSHLPNRVIFVDMGPGTETKQDFFIQDILQRGKKLTYCPVDINKRILKSASLHVKKQGTLVTPVHASFEEMFTLLPTGDTPRFLFLGLTFLNLELNDAIRMLKKNMKKNGCAFINTQPRERIADMRLLMKAYSTEHFKKIYNEKLRLLGLSLDKQVGCLEITDGIEVYFTIKEPTRTAKKFALHSGDRLLIFQSIRYPLRVLRSALEKNFSCTYFKTKTAYTAVLLKKI